MSHVMIELEASSQTIKYSEYTLTNMTATMEDCISYTGAVSNLENLEEAFESLNMEGEVEVNTGDIIQIDNLPACHSYRDPIYDL